MNYIDWQEHMAGLLIAGFFYLFNDNELGATTCWKTATTILTMHKV
jgi:hypothetical protein